MPRSFFKQEKGLLIPPPGVSKWRVSWSLDNVLEGFKHFYQEHGRWPLGNDLMSCPYLPNTKTIERKFGGIVEVRKKLGIDQPHFNAGSRRSKKASELWTRGFVLEEEIYEKLLHRFHEPFVHNQGRMDLGQGSVGRADFIVYHTGGKFFVDVFFPDDAQNRFASNVVAKVRTYQNICYPIFLVVGNPTISQQAIELHLSKMKLALNPHLTFLTKEKFLDTLGDFQPLQNPLD